MLTIENIRMIQGHYSVIQKRYVIGTNFKPKYQLLKDLKIQLTDGNIITIPQGFVWDLSSVPRMLWWLLPPDGDFGIAYIIHDYLWVYKHQFNYSQKWTDQEMKRWAMASSGTNGPSLCNLDIWARYLGVRAFGWLVWKGIIKI
jgi:hypothetical protein